MIGDLALCDGPSLSVSGRRPDATYRYLLQVRDGIRAIVGQNFWRQFRRQALNEADLAEYARGLSQQMHRFSMQSFLTLVCIPSQCFRADCTCLILAHLL